MASDASWLDTLPSVTDHPAAFGGTPTVPPAPAPTAPQSAAAPPVSAPQAPSWTDALPSVTEHPAAMAPQTEQAPVAMHPTAGPSDSLATDVGRRLATAGTDALGGFLGLPSAAAHAVDWAGRKIGVDPGAQAALGSIPGGNGMPLFPDPATAREMAYQTTGATEYVPETAAGRIGQAALTGAITAPLGGAAALARGIPAVARAVGAALPGATAAGAAAGGAAEIAPDNPLFQIGAALVTHKLASGAANVAGTAAGQRVPVGGPLDPETAALAQTAQAHGIPLAPGQLSGNFAVRNLYDMGAKVPLSGADAFAGDQQTAFNRAVNRTFGSDAEKVTPDVLNDAHARIGGVFNGVAARTAIPMTNQFMGDLQGVVNNARLSMSADSVEPVERQAMNIIDTAANNGGNIGGRAYIDLTAKGGPLDTMMQSSDSGMRAAGRQLRTILDNNLQANATPGDVPALQQARAQWKAMKTVEPLTVRADAVGGVTPSTGDVSPAALRGAVNQSYNNAALAPLGQIPLNDLAKVGQRFLKAPQSSGTAERNLTNDLIKGGGAAAASLVGAHEAGINPLYTVGPAVGSMVLNRAAQAALRNQAIARAQIAGSLNPSGFQFRGSPALTATIPGMLPPPSGMPLPFAWPSNAGNNSSMSQTP